MPTADIIVRPTISGNPFVPISDIFMQDQVTNQAFLISVNSRGVAGNNLSFLPTISADGHHIVYPSAANNLVIGDTIDSAF
jgi:hypothetical protein